MIADVDASLRALLRAGALHDADVEVAFEPPSATWAGGVTAATLNLHLVEIREDLERLPSDWEEVRGDAGRVMAWRPPLRRYRLRYLATAWGGGAEEEHALLSRLLATLAEVQAIPREHLAGALRDEDAPVYVRVAPPAQDGVAPWAMWSALGVAPRAALEVVVLAPLPRAVTMPAAAPVLTRRGSLWAAPMREPEMLRSEARDAALQRRGGAGAPSGAVAKPRGRAATRRVPLSRPGLGGAQSPDAGGGGKPAPDA